jgi:Delta14-sterol reductase
MLFVPSPTGSKLLAGGWWGTSRHINYLGDWLLSLGMSLPTGEHA